MNESNAWAGADPVRTFLPAPYWGQARDEFIYSLSWNPLAADARGDVRSFTVDANTDFLALAVALVIADSAGTARQTYAPIEIVVNDSASSGNWQAGGGGAQPGALHLQAFAGTMTENGPGAFRFPQPRFVAGSTQVTVALTNLDAADPFRVWLSFHGVKIYRGMTRA